MTEPAVTETPPSESPVINGFTALADATRNGAASASSPPWPLDDLDNPPAAPIEPQLDPVALQILQETYAARATLTPLEPPVEVARRALQFGAGTSTAASLRALAAAGVARASTGDDVARTLRAANVDRIGNQLQLVADGLTPAGTAIPPESDPSTFWPAATRLYDVLTAHDLRTLLNNRVEQPPANAPTSADPPRGFDAGEMRTRGRFNRALDRRIASIDAGPAPEPGVRDAFVWVKGAVDNVIGYPPRAFALQLAGFAQHPQQAVERVREFANGLNLYFNDDREAQLAALRPFAGDQTLAEHLHDISNATETIINDPAQLAHVHAGKMFGTNGFGLWYRDRQTAAAVSSPAPPAALSPAVANAVANAVAPPGNGPAPAAPTPPEVPAPVETTAPAESAAPAEEVAGNTAGPAATRADEAMRPYRYNPELMPEHALLGSILHAPNVIDGGQAARDAGRSEGLISFLRPRNFSSDETRAAYETLVGLHQDGRLFDILSPDLKSNEARLGAAVENRRTLYAALQAAPSKYTKLTVADPQALLAQLEIAAPMETRDTRSVYDPVAQLHLGRMVLDDAADRINLAAGTMIERKVPLVAPARTSATKSERDTRVLIQNLETIDAQLGGLTEQLIKAVQQTGPDAADENAAEVAISSATRRWRIPDQLRAITNPRQDKAERHLIHLALHAGEMKEVPEEILNLTPADFASTRHANTWRAIQDLHSRGQAVNYASVIREGQGDTFPHRPMMSDSALFGMRQRPELRPERVARSLQIVVTAALARMKTDTQHAIAAMSAGPHVPASQSVAAVRGRITDLKNRAHSALPPPHRDTSATASSARTGGR